GECVVSTLRAVPPLENLLERREIGIAVFPVRDDLPVDQARWQVERRELRDQRGELVAPVLAAAGIDAHVLPRCGDERAVAVELDLVHPAVARRYGIDQRGELGRAELRRL